MQRILFILLTLAISFSVRGKEEFTQLEQQQISIETPGLFSRSKSFQVDFGQLSGSEYSFPLPVGEVKATSARELTIETKKGDAVKAMFGGTVRLSRSTQQQGNVIVVRHDNGLETVYAHNAQNLVKVGDRVKAGQTIAIVGSDGGTPHLVFSIMVDGNKINPSTILNVHTHHLHKQIVTITKTGKRIDVKTNRAKSATSGDTGNGKGGKQKASEPDQPKMSLDTNDPFQGNAVYRLNLDKIRAGQWHYPLDGAHVISGYGGARHHSGVDIKNGPGNDVYAAFDGLVVQSGVFSGYGKCITIRHENGLETRYSHNSKNYVNVGDHVKAGQVIGVVGRTGRATTEHVHFETRIAGRAFDPAYIFDHAKNALQTGTLQFKKNGSVARLKK